MINPPFGILWPKSILKKPPLRCPLAREVKHQPSLPAWLNEFFKILFRDQLIPHVPRSPLLHCTYCIFHLMLLLTLWSLVSNALWRANQRNVRTFSSPFHDQTIFHFGSIWSHLWQENLLFAKDAEKCHVLVKSHTLQSGSPPLVGPGIGSI